jgi:hypothetical protein
MRLSPLVDLGSVQKMLVHLVTVAALRLQGQWLLLLHQPQLQEPTLSRLHTARRSQEVVCRRLLLHIHSCQTLGQEPILRHR